MKQYNILIRLIVTTILLLCMMGCVDEELIGGGTSSVAKDKVVIKMTIPNMEIPTLTRSNEDKIWERNVEVIDLFIFDSSTPSQIIKHVTIKKFTQDVSEKDYKIQFLLTLGEYEDYSDASSVLLIANAHKEVESALVTGPINGKKDLLKRLIFKTNKNAQGSYKWNVSSSSNFTPIPMYGEIWVNGISQGMTIDGIEMKRMLARIDVQNNVNESIFKLEKIYLANYLTGGYIAPAWNESTGDILHEMDEAYPYSRNRDPKIPPGIDKPKGTQEEAMMYTYSQMPNAPGSLLEGQIYTYEVPKSTSEGGVCLILQGIYEGRTYYYRVNFTSDKEKHESGLDVFRGDNVPLYRNHKYVVTITAAEGVGYTSFNEAIKASSVLSNLKTSTLVVDMAGINNIVYDGQYFMGTEGKTLNVPWNAGKDIWHKVSSDYQGNWSAEIIKPDNSPWLTFTNGSTITNGQDINYTGLNFRVTPLPSPPQNNKEAIGRIIFTAGRLRDTLDIRRVTMAELFARSNVLASPSGGITFAVSEADNYSLPSNIQGLFFKWGSLLGLAPVGNPYNPRFHCVFNPTNLSPENWGGELEGWDRIPYAHQNFNFTSSIGGDDVDAFKTYNNNIGFDVSKGIGDVCRYIASRPGWAGGHKWRMPTYYELQLLYNETLTNQQRIPGIGDFKDVTNIYDPFAKENKDGKYAHNSGVMLGFRASNSMPINKPAVGAVFLPASGLRYPDGNGDAVHAGAYGYYWSSTPYDAITVNYLFLHRNGAMFYDADRSYAFPVRCIRDYEFLDTFTP